MSEWANPRVEGRCERSHLTGENELARPRHLGYKDNFFSSSPFADADPPASSSLP